MRRLFAMLALGTVTAQTQACARNRDSDLELSVKAATSHAALLIVNYTTEAVRVSLITRGVAHPLGPVPSLGSRIFQVPFPPGATVVEYQLQAHERSGALRFQSAAFTIARGQIARWPLSPLQGVTVYVK